MSNDWSLKDIFYAVNKFPTTRNLQDVVYVAQELGTLTKKYEFIPSGSSFALPQSPDLEKDLLLLKYKGIVYDTQKPGTITLTIELDSTKLNEEAINGLKKLAQIDRTRLDSLTSVMWAKNVLKEEKNKSVSVRPVQIANYLAVDVEKVKSYLDLAKRLQEQ